MSEDNVAQWAIVELMGHKVVAGQAAKSEQMGAPMLRVDVPETSAYPKFTQFYGTAAIYCITFVSEKVARLTAEECKINPVSVYTPDLITREQHNEEVVELVQRIALLKKALPEPDRPEDGEPFREDDDGDLGEDA